MKLKLQTLTLATVAAASLTAACLANSAPVSLAAAYNNKAPASAAAPATPVGPVAGANAETTAPATEPPSLSAKPLTVAATPTTVGSIALNAVPAAASNTPTAAPAAASNTPATSPFAPFTPLTAAQRAARPRQAPLPGAASASTTPASAAAAVDTSATQADAPRFISEDKWILAGYNNDELVYTVVVTNQDTHIIRCTTEVNGFYIEDGKKLTITDRQITTVFPNQPTRTGYWMDMDKDSGATYAVKCKAV